MAIFAGGLVYAKLKNPITLDQAKIKAESFINKNLMQPGTKIAIKGAEDKNGLYKIAVNNGSATDIDTYISKDGKIFFPQAIDIEKMESDKKAAQANPAATPAPLVKNDKPSVEVFVMSHCPYGTQIEKGILGKTFPVIYSILQIPYHSLNRTESEYFFKPIFHFF